MPIEHEHRGQRAREIDEDDAAGLPSSPAGGLRIGHYFIGE
jgi:hypothetical protein